MVIRTKSYLNYEGCLEKYSRGGEEELKSHPTGLPQTARLHSSNQIIGPQLTDGLAVALAQLGQNNLVDVLVYCVGALARVNVLR